MYTSDKKAIRNCIGHICASLFLAFFGAVYEKYSHEVYSYFMIYAFAIPLLFGALPFGLAALKNVYPNDLAVNLWNSAIASLSVGSIFKGVLDIYGTTNRLIIVYPIVGIVFAAVSIIIISLFQNQRNDVAIQINQSSKQA